MADKVQAEKLLLSEAGFEGQNDGRPDVVGRGRKQLVKLGRGEEPGPRP